MLNNRARDHILQYRILLHTNAKDFVINIDSNVPTKSSTQFFISVLRTLNENDVSQSITNYTEHW